jgi:hypothetical protein
MRVHVNNTVMTMRAHDGSPPPTMMIAIIQERNGVICSHAAAAAAAVYDGSRSVYYSLCTPYDMRD